MIFQFFTYEYTFKTFYSYIYKHILIAYMMTNVMWTYVLHLKPLNLIMHNRYIYRNIYVYKDIWRMYI